MVRAGQTPQGVMGLVEPARMDERTRGEASPHGWTAAGRVGEYVLDDTLPDRLRETSCVESL